MNVPDWWTAVEVGDKLREVGGPEQKDDRLLHVVATFYDAGSYLVVTKEWWSTKQRWNYAVQTDVRAIVGSIYPDGSERPTR